MQLMGELILAHAYSMAPGAKVLETQDYEGNPLAVKLNPELTPLENAQRYFDKAKKAKAGSATVNEQIQRISTDLAAIDSILLNLEEAESLDQIKDLQAESRKRNWLHQQRAPTTKKEERPYEGHRIRELLGPQGLKILYGETATANDYLTLRVAKQNDYWLHIRAGVSAHVIIQTGNHPEKVSRETLMFAAKIAVQNSPQKHAGYVPVDYTLKKYVRKPKGAPVGTALYTHEKTLHVES
jgi:predicted ribosome quality control (RQC) complex YloA/Tae2 family protein